MRGSCRILRRRLASPSERRLDDGNLYLALRWVLWRILGSRQLDRHLRSLPAVLEKSWGRPRRFDKLDDQFRRIHYRAHHAREDYLWDLHLLSRVYGVRDPMGDLPVAGNQGKVFGRDGESPPDSTVIVSPADNRVLSRLPTGFGLWLGRKYGQLCKDAANTRRAGDPGTDSYRRVKFLALCVRSGETVATCDGRPPDGKWAGGEDPVKLGSIDDPSR